MRVNLLRLIVFLGSFLLSYSGNAQTTVALPMEKDAFFVSINSTTNFGTNDILAAGSFGVSDSIFRTALQIDLNSIPSNVVILSAKLFLYKNTDTTNLDTNFVLQRFESSWSETGITYSNQPSVDAGSISLQSAIGGVFTFDITTAVSEMCAGLYSNYGWMVRGGNETVNNGEQYFYSKEYSDAALHPYVEIVYSAPFEFINAVVNHATDSTTSDGSIIPELAGGSHNYLYNWIDGSTGGSLGTAATLTGLSYGWYGLHVTDAITNEEEYMAFIVGAKNDEVTVDFKPGPNYTDDAIIYNLVKNGINYGDLNYGNYTTILSENWTNGSWYSVKTALKFRLWMDPSFNIEQADLHLSGNNHYPLSRPNTSEFVKITQNWEEHEITYNTQPSTGDTPIEVVSGTSQGNDNKVVDMRSFWNEWATDNSGNYGVMLQLQLYNNQYTRMSFHSSDALDATKHPWIQFTVSTPVLTSWNDTTELGSIELDISSLSVTGPFHYILSADPIPDLTETYQEMVDSLPIPIDSASFFQGYYTSSTHTFSGYSPGKYFVSVFDSQQNRILDKTVFVEAPIQFDSETGLIAQGSTISTDSTQAYGALLLYTSENSDGSFDVEVSRGGNDKQFIGLMSPDVKLGGVENLTYGVYLDGDELFVVDNGVLNTVNAFTVPLTVSPLVFEITSGNLSIKGVGGYEYLNTTLPSSYAYQVAVGTAYAATMDIKVSEGYTLKSVPTVNINVTPGSCFDSNGTIELTYSVSGLFAQFYTFDAPTVTNLSTNATITMNTVDPGIYGLSNLLPGTYVVYPSGTFTTSTSTVNVPFTPQVIQIHSKVVWTNLIETEFSPLGNFPQSESLTRNSLSSGEIIGSAQVKHDLNTVDDNALFFNLNLPNTLDNCILRWTSQTDMAGTVYSGITLESYTGIIFVNGANGVFVGKLVNGVMQGIQGPQTAFAPVSNGASLGYYYSTTTGDAWLEESTFGNGTSALVPAYSVGGTPTHLSVNTGAMGTGIYSTLTNMPCIVPNIYAKVERKLRGVKYRVYENTIRFYVDEEYNASGLLKYRIYSEYDRVTPVQDWTTVSQNVKYGDNRYVLDVTGNVGVFILEVENDKKEKFYLRFEN